MISFTCQRYHILPPVDDFRFLVVKIQFLLKGPIPSILVFFFIINQKPVIPRTDFIV